MRFWPRSLAGQLILGLLTVMVVAHLVSFFAFMDERRFAVREAIRAQSLSRIASVVRLVEITPPEARQDIVREASGPLFRFSLSAESHVENVRSGFPESRIERRLARRLGEGNRTIRVGVREEGAWFWRWGPWRGSRSRSDHWDGEEDSFRHGGFHGRGGRLPVAGMTISIRLADHSWLNAQARIPRGGPGWAAASVTAMAVTALALVVVTILLVRRVTRPLAGLAAAAERAGRGAAVAPLPEEGPRDIRETIAAFNRMQDRQQRYTEDRTRMLAAISHDLRTPITSLRIRAEFIEDAELREKILATLDEMQSMAEATLSFVREDATAEAFSDTDLGVLVESLCADLAELGESVRFQPAQGDRLILPCRPNALRRALRNILDNAIAYAGSADVRIEKSPAGVAIHVEDDGPGIAEADMQRVFDPFVRLEESRNPQTGGIGLGMAIARTVMRAHGGDVVIANRPEGGLRVSLQFPPAGAT